MTAWWRWRFATRLLPPESPPDVQHRDIHRYHYKNNSGERLMDKREPLFIIKI
jgi:hypothetical protein